MDSKITVEVVYARAETAWRVSLDLAAGSTLGQALEASGFAAMFPDYPVDRLGVGVYGQTCSNGYVLRDGDRVEIYRPLTFDPMESRRRRALHRKAFMTKRLSRA